MRHWLLPAVHARHSHFCGHATCRPPRLLSAVRKITPNIDSIARNGTLFSQVSALVPLTLPSHVALFTSTYPLANGVDDNGVPFGAGTTLATVLKNAGYRTAAFEPLRRPSSYCWTWPARSLRRVPEPFQAQPSRKPRRMRSLLVACCSQFHTTAPGTYSLMRTSCPQCSRAILLSAGLTFPVWDLMIAIRLLWCTLGITAVHSVAAVNSTCFKRKMASGSL